MTITTTSRVVMDKYGYGHCFWSTLWNSSLQPTADTDSSRVHS